MNRLLISARQAPMVIGHRGASGHALENSAAAFRLATDATHSGSCEGVELDIHATSDGTFVVHHDPTFASGDPIADTLLSRARATFLGDGSAVPVLEEALAILEGLEIFIEVKGRLDDQGATALVKQLSGDRSGRLHVHSFDHRIVRRLRDRSTELSLGILSTSYPIDPVRPVVEAGATTLWQEWHLVDRALVTRCHDAGIAVVAWTVNQRDQAASLRELGVDALCGNWPERLRP